MIGILVAALALIPQEPGPKIDTTPSDPAAVGFLTGYVDPRVYNLPDQGATRWQGTVDARVGGLSSGLNYEFDYDLSHGALTVMLRGSPPADATTDLLVKVTALVNQTLTLFHRCSFGASGYVLQISREQEIVVLTYKPRRQDSGGTSSWWYQPDGTPLRELAAGGPQGERVTTTTHYEEHEGRLVLRGASIDDGTEYIYNYTEVDGYRVLSNMEYTQGRTSITFQLTSHVEPAREP